MVIGKWLCRGGDNFVNRGDDGSESHSNGGSGGSAAVNVMMANVLSMAATVPIEMEVIKVVS